MTALLDVPEVIRYRNEVERRKRAPAPVFQIVAEDGFVKIKFPFQVRNMGLTADMAREMATGLLGWANEVEKQNKDKAQ